MKKADVKIGGVYIAKVSGALKRVRLDAENRYGGWDATSLESGRKIRVRSAARLRHEVNTEVTPETKVS